MKAELVYLGIMFLTGYQPIERQTDGSPTWTSIGDRTTVFGAAVSRDLLASGRACYGDILVVEGYGPRIINDVMAARHRGAVDILVRNTIEESYIRNQRRRVWVMRSPVRSCGREGAMRMGMENARKIRESLDRFKAEHGREPTQAEFRRLLTGEQGDRPKEAAKE